jgi:transcriptional regulator with XRE-family HTH domain
MSLRHGAVTMVRCPRAATVIGWQIWGGRPCPDRGAQPRRDSTGAGGPGQRAAPHLGLPAEFYEDPGLSAALARLEFGPVFRRVHAEQRWSQHMLGALLGLDQAAISRIENGQRSLTDAAAVIRCANVLGIPAGKLGFRYGVTLGPCAVQAEPTGTRHVGAADVEAIEAATAAFSAQDFAQGSGIARETALTHLRVTLPLLGAQTRPEVRPRLLIATAHLALMAGWMSFDVHQHDAARRLWMIGLDVARAAEDPWGCDLTVYLLYDMALQAVHLWSSG